VVGGGGSWWGAAAGFAGEVRGTFVGGRGQAFGGSRDWLCSQGFSGIRGGFSNGRFLVAEITAALVTLVSVDAIATSRVVASRFEGLFDFGSTALAIQITLRLTISYYNGQVTVFKRRACVQEELSPSRLYYGR